MLSTLIYETVDFVYTLARLTKRVIKGSYNWYYKIETEEQVKIKLLEERIVEQRLIINKISV